MKNLTDNELFAYHVLVYFSNFATFHPLILWTYYSPQHGFPFKILGLVRALSFQPFSLRYRACSWIWLSELPSLAHSMWTFIRLNVPIFRVYNTYSSRIYPLWVQDNKNPILILQRKNSLYFVFSFSICWTPFDCSPNKIEYWKANLLFFEFVNIEFSSFSVFQSTWHILHFLYLYEKRRTSIQFEIQGETILFYFVFSSSLV